MPSEKGFSAQAKYASDFLKYSLFINFPFFECLARRAYDAHAKYASDFLKLCLFIYSLFLKCLARRTFDAQTKNVCKRLLSSEVLLLQQRRESGARLQRGKTGRRSPWRRDELAESRAELLLWTGWNLERRREGEGGCFLLGDLEKLCIFPKIGLLFKRLSRVLRLAITQWESEFVEDFVEYIKLRKVRILDFRLGFFFLSL